MNKTSLNEFYSRIIADERKVLEKQKMLLPPENIAELCMAYRRQHRDLQGALLARESREKPGKVGILQKAFPRRGVVAEPFDHLQLAEKFAESCAAIGVVTEKNYFEGAPSMLSGITHLVKLPVIRWDIHFDEYQLWQSRLWGADAVRFNVSSVSRAELLKLCKLAAELELEIVMEVASAEEAAWVVSQNIACSFFIEGENASIEDLNQIITLIPETTPVLLNRNINPSSPTTPLPCDDEIIFAL